MPYPKRQIYSLVLVLSLVATAPGSPQNAGATAKIPIQRIETEGIADGPVLTLKDASKLVLVNLIPADVSAESAQNSGPVLSVHPDGQLLAASWFGDFDHPGTQGAPLYISEDGGWSWQVKNVIRATQVTFQTYSFSGSGKRLYGAVMDGTMSLVSVLKTEDPTSDRPLDPISTLSSGATFADSPFIAARTFDQDRIYVGQNYFGPELGNQTASVRVSTDGGVTFRLLGLEARTTAGQDAPQVQPAIAKDGTVYVAFIRWTSVSYMPAGAKQFTGDIVICRDDEGAKGSAPFGALRDSSDRKPGRIVESGRVFPWNSNLGQQRIGSSLSLAVDPDQSSRVLLAWTDLVDNTYTIHLRKSEDRGETWSEELRNVPSATNPAVAIAEDGGLGFLYQQLADVGKATERWETHFETSSDGGASWSDLLLSTFPAKSPIMQYQPYLADRNILAAVGHDFYGVFAASNNPDPKLFPQGVHFQRRHRIGKLLAADGVGAVPISIDPYFFHFKSDPFGMGEGFEVGGSVVEVSEPLDHRSFWIQLSVAIASLLAMVVVTGWYVRRRWVGSVEQLIESKVRGPVLGNYTGFLSVAFVDSSDHPIEEADQGQACFLLVGLAKQPAASMRSEPVDLRGGADLNEVAFKISVDANDFVFPKDRGELFVPRRGGANTRFKAFAPREPGNHAVFVQLFQKTRLIQVASAMLRVR
jgi:hypothetical protein